MVVAPSASYSFDLVEMTGQRVIRDITVKARDSRHGHDIVDRLKTVGGVRVADISDRTFLMYLGGKIEIVARRLPHADAPVGP